MSNAREPLRSSGAAWNGREGPAAQPSDGAAGPLPYPLATRRHVTPRLVRPAPSSTTEREAAATYSGLLLPWHTVTPAATVPHLEVEPSAAHMSTHGALALLEHPELAPLLRPASARHAILLAEDDARLAGAVRSALELEGEPEWSVTVANDGLRALELATLHPPHVVLLDIYLPGVDGVEVYRRLRANPQTRETRVLFVSAATSLDLYERGVRDGVLLRKPFDVRDLVGLVRALLAE